jgi:pSer/pThr/pTyr-binding forkhead associated (FHA) protein
MASHIAGEAAASGGLECTQCSTLNPTSNRFCAACGYQLEAVAAPEPPSMASLPSDLRLTALRADGSELGTFSITDGVAVGRDTGAIFSGDNYLSPTHAVFTRQGPRVLVHDTGSLNGVYLKLRANAPWRLRWGDMFRVGQQILRLESLEGPNQYTDDVRHSAAHAWLCCTSGTHDRSRDDGQRFLDPQAGFHLGRERGHALFAEDGYVSSLHCQLSVDGNDAIWLTDLGSSNGSFVRLNQETRRDGRRCVADGATALPPRFLALRIGALEQHAGAWRRCLGLKRASGHAHPSGGVETTFWGANDPLAAAPPPGVETTFGVQTTLWGAAPPPGVEISFGVQTTLWGAAPPLGVETSFGVQNDPPARERLLMPLARRRSDGGPARSRGTRRRVRRSSPRSG